MKKLSYALLPLLAIPFFGCADDDDDSGAITCTVEKTTCTKASDCRSCACGDEAGTGAVCTEQGVCSCGSCRVAKPGELVINEVKIKKPEFIEIVNTTSDALGLGGLTITSYANNGSSKDVKLKTGCIGPKGAVAITSQGEAEVEDPDAGVDAKNLPNPWIWSRSGKALKSEEDGTTKLGFVDSPASDTVKFLLSGSDGTVISSFKGEKELFTGSGSTKNSVTRSPDLGEQLARHSDVSPTGVSSSPAKCMNGGEFEDGCVEPKCETADTCKCEDDKKYGCCDTESHTCYCTKFEDCSKEEVVVPCNIPEDAVPVSAAGEIVINELRTKAPEFVEIVNTTDHRIALKGLTFHSSNQAGELKKRTSLTDGWLDAHESVAIFSKLDWVWSAGEVCSADEQKGVSLSFADKLDVSEAVIQLRYADGSEDGLLVDELKVPKDLYIYTDKTVSVTRSPDLTGDPKLSIDVLACKSTTPGTCSNGQEFKLGCNTEPAKHPCACESKSDCECEGNLYGCCSDENLCYCSKTESCEVEVKCDIPENAVAVNAAGQIVMNELRAKAPEFVELVNTTDHGIALKGLTFYSSDKTGALKKRKTLTDGWLDAHEAVALFSKGDWVWSVGEGCSADDQEKFSLAFADTLDVNEAVVQLYYDDGSEEGLLVDELRIPKDPYLDAKRSVTRSPDITGSDLKLSSEILECKEMTPASCSTGQTFKLGCSTPVTGDPCLCGGDDQCFDALCTSKTKPVNICGDEKSCECVACSKAADCAATCGDLTPSCEENQCECACQSAEQCSCEDGKTPVCNGGECGCECNQASQCSCDNGLTPVCNGGECGCACDSVDQCSCEEEYETPVCNSDGTCGCTTTCTPPTMGGDLTINEISVKMTALGKAEDEWVEIVNTSGHDLLLKDVKFYGNTSSTTQVSQNTDLDLRFEIAKGCIGRGQAFVVRRGVGIEINGEVITDIQSATTSTMKSLTNSGYLTFKLNYEPASGTGERLLDFVSYDGQPSADTSLGRFPDITGDLKPHSEGSGGVKHSRGFCNGTQNEFPSCLNFIK